MKTKDLLPIIFVSAAAAVLGFIASNFIPDVPDSHTIDGIIEVNADFPDAKETKEIFDEEASIDIFVPTKTGADPDSE